MGTQNLSGWDALVIIAVIILVGYIVKKVSEF